MIENVSHITNLVALETRALATLAHNKLTSTNIGDEIEFQNTNKNGVKSIEKINDLTENEKSYIEKLKQREQEVRRHEEAHRIAAGELASGAPNYTYKMGPDGKRYIVGGHVNIDVAEVPGNPKKTIEKARKVVRAALAPADPSPKDRQIAAQAKNMETKAQMELSKMEQVGIEEKTNNSLKSILENKDFYSSNGFVHSYSKNEIDVLI